MGDNAINGLRRRFVILATLAVVIIITIALGLINMIGYYSTSSRVQRTLEVIMVNDGHLPRKPPPGDALLGAVGWDANTPEFAVQTRFFSVAFDADGTVTSMNKKNIMAFDEKEIISYARAEIDLGEKNGYFRKNGAEYGFLVSDMPNGGCRVAIIDCTSEFHAVHAFFVYSFLFGLLCVCFFMLIFTAMSGHVIAPFVRNMESQKRFITNAGHELKTPIAIISANAEAIEMLSGSSEWTDGIKKQVKRLTGLINDLVMLSKMGEALFSNQKDNFDKSNEASMIAKSFQPLASEAGKTLSAHIEEGVHIVSDRKLVYELMSILLDNAVKYCDDGGKIDMRLRHVKHVVGGRGALIILTNDYKEGRDTDYKRFFDRFYRSDESHNSEKAGYGIGLSLAAELVKQLHAKLRVKWSGGRITFAVKIG